MKKHILILVMLLIATTSFAQPSRRTTNSTRPSGNEKRTERTVEKKRTEVRKANTQSRNKSSVNKSGVTRSREVRPDNKPSGQNRERKPTQPREKKQNVIRQPVGQPKAVKERPPQYHSSRRFIEPRPVIHHYKRPPRPREYRAKRFPYRRPPRIHIYWSLHMRNDYLRFYPVVRTWRYPVGYRIPTISAYDALYYNGEVMSVYGKVYEVFYSGRTDEYFLYFGAYYPYHDFTVVLPGWIARRYSSYPEGYFRREHVIVTGLITSFNDSPEIVVKSEGQLRIY